MSAWDPGTGIDKRHPASVAGQNTPLPSVYGPQESSSKVLARASPVPPLRTDRDAGRDRTRSNAHPEASDRATKSAFHCLPPDCRSLVSVRPPRSKLPLLKAIGKGAPCSLASSATRVPTRSRISRWAARCSGLPAGRTRESSSRQQRGLATDPKQLRHARKAQPHHNRWHDPALGTSRRNRPHPLCQPRCPRARPTQQRRDDRNRMGGHHPDAMHGHDNRAAILSTRPKRRLHHRHQGTHWEAHRRTRQHVSPKGIPTQLAYTAAVIC